MNFYHDHTKLILCTQQDEYLLTYINEERTSATFQLSTLLSAGCTADLRSRLEYALNMLLLRWNWAGQMRRAVGHWLSMSWWCLSMQGQWGGNVDQMELFRLLRLCRFTNDVIRWGGVMWGKDYEEERNTGLGPGIPQRETDFMCVCVCVCVVKCLWITHACLDLQNYCFVSFLLSLQNIYCVHNCLFIYLMNKAKNILTTFHQWFSSFSSLFLFLFILVYMQWIKNYIFINVLYTLLLYYVL